VEAVWDFVSCSCSEGRGGCECPYGDLSELESCWLWYVSSILFMILILNLKLISYVYTDMIRVSVITGAVRIEHQFYALGQACANACDIALDTMGSGDSSLVKVQDVPYAVLRERLLAQGAVLDASLVGKPDFSLLHG